MQEIEDYWKKKDKCIADLEDALPRLKPQLDEIDTRLSAYIEDALSNHASHANMFELLGIRKVMRLMVSYKMDGPRVKRTIPARGQVRGIHYIWMVFAIFSHHCLKS